MDKVEALLNYLLRSSDYVISSKISDDLGISIRSIRSYVKVLNDKYSTAEQAFITSNKLGYKIQNKELYYGKKETDSGIIDTFGKRKNYLIREFLINHKKTIDINDYCDETFVSLSTAKKDISRINDIYKGQNVKINLNKDLLMISGESKDLKRVLSNTIKEEAPNEFITLDLVERIFENYDVYGLYKSIQKILDESNIYVNELNYLNLILHILIVIDNKDVSSVPDADTFLEHYGREEVVNKIIEEIRSIVGKDADSHITELKILLRSNVNHQYIDGLKLDNDKFIKIAMECAIKIKKNYSIDLTNHSFINPLALHIKLLKYRCEHIVRAVNPVMKVLKDNYPLIYDIAIFASNIIENRLGYTIPESEISFLAMHIGGELERQNNDDNKIITMLIAPMYTDIASKLYDKIMRKFSDDISILATYSTIDDVPDDFENDYELVISIYDRPNYPFSVTFTQISTYFDSKDLLLVDRAIEKIRLDQKLELLRSNFSNYFSNDLFFVSKGVLSSKEEIISFLSDRLSEKGYVKKDLFYKSVMLRESKLSTAYNKIAIPHSMSILSNKTSIAIYIDPEGIEWDAHKTVYIVFLIAINSDDSSKFADIYEAFISLIDQDIILNELIQSKSLDEFYILLSKHIPA